VAAGAAFRSGERELAVTVAAAGALGLFGPVGESAADETVSVYRAVSLAENDDIAATGTLRPVAGSIEKGKWCSTSAEGAQKWGGYFYGNSPYKIVEIRLPRGVANRLYGWANLDDRGGAVFIDQADYGSISRMSTYSSH
jgi:hypothetical protein